LFTLDNEAMPQTSAAFMRFHPRLGILVSADSGGNLNQTKSKLPPQPCRSVAPFAVAKPALRHGFD
jgi:hypothetical protein